MKLKKAITTITTILSFSLVSQSGKASDLDFDSVLIKGKLKVVRMIDGKRETLTFKAPGKEQHILKQNDLIVAEEKSLILLKTDAVLDLKEKTRLRLDKISIENGLKNSTLHLFEGLVRSSVSGLKKDESFTIKNKDAAMSVRGTIVIVESKPESVQIDSIDRNSNNLDERKEELVVTCVEGSVDVQTTSETGGIDKKVSIKENEQASTGQSEISVKEIPAVEIRQMNQDSTVQVSLPPPVLPSPDGTTTSGAPTRALASNTTLSSEEEGPIAETFTPDELSRFSDIKAPVTGGPAKITIRIFSR